MGETLTLFSHKVAEERHGDEKEKDDEENRAADHTLGLGPESIENTFFTRFTKMHSTFINEESVLSATADIFRLYW